MIDLADRKTWLVEGVRKRLGIDRAVPRLTRFSKEAEQARKEYGRPEGDLAKAFFETDGRTVDKWLHYLPVYERYLEKYRGTDFSMLEIGVFRGGSQELWRKYFGDRMQLFAIDIDPDCASVVDAPNHVRIGSQADPKFLRKVAAEMGRINVILDDGSHVADHQQISFDTLFPLLADGGLYIIEDIHTSYWRWNFRGGYGRAGTAVELAKQVMDDLHHWYHGRAFATVAQGEISAVHMYDSIVVFEKNAKKEPIRTRVGPNAAAR